MKIIYVPDTIGRALEQAHVEKTAVLNVERLLGILSPDDVGFYTNLNMHLELLLPKAVADTMQWRGWELYEALMRISGSYAEPRDSVSGGPTYDPALARKAREAIDSCCTYGLQGGLGHLKLAGKQLTCDLLDEATIRFTHIPMEESAADGNVRSTQLPLLERVLQQLYPFVPFQELVDTPLFADYLQQNRFALTNASRV